MNCEIADFRAHQMVFEAKPHIDLQTNTCINLLDVSFHVIRWPDELCSKIAVEVSSGAAASLVFLLAYLRRPFSQNHLSAAVHPPKKQRFEVLESEPS
jgi:hypothetical protein